MYKLQNMDALVVIDLAFVKNSYDIQFKIAIYHHIISF